MQRQVCVIDCWVFICGLLVGFFWGVVLGRGRGNTRVLGLVYISWYLFPHTFISLYCIHSIIHSLHCIHHSLIHVILVIILSFISLSSFPNSYISLHSFPYSFSLPGRSASRVVAAVSMATCASRGRSRHGSSRRSRRRRAR